MYGRNLDAESDDGNEAGFFFCVPMDGRQRPMLRVVVSAWSESWNGTGSSAIAPVAGRSGSAARSGYSTRPQSARPR
jgi:hypothetical protein